MTLRLIDYARSGPDDPAAAFARLWEKTDRNGHAMLGGATSYPLPGKSEIEQQDAAQELKELVESGAVTKGMPKSKKGRAGDQARA